MTTELFDNAIYFTDIHFGKKNNSRQHNEDCLDFLKWMIKQAKDRGIKTCIFGGDYHHHRSSLNVYTLYYIMESLRLLDENFDKVYMLVGNHDLFYREKRDVHSLIMGQRFDNIEIIDEHTVIGDVAFVPWLVEDEWTKVKKIKSKYMFGHFEIPGFKMNAMIEMPDHGQINKSHFKNQDLVFSGHFHKRQRGGNIIYPGNPFGHDYSDTWDFDRGCMILEWGGEPEFINWEDSPKYITCNLSDLLENKEKFLLPKSYVKVTVDVDVTYEEVNDIKIRLAEEFDIRELKIIPRKPDEEEHEFEGDIRSENVDQIVTKQITSLESEKFSTHTLLQIFNGLD